MTSRRRTEIIVETQSLTIIRIRGGRTDWAFCEDCRRNVQIFAPAHAALIFGVNAEFIESLFRAKQIHAASENQVCADSLAVYFKQELRFVED